MKASPLWTFSYLEIFMKILLVTKFAYYYKISCFDIQYIVKELKTSAQTETNCNWTLKRHGSPHIQKETSMALKSSVSRWRQRNCRLLIWWSAELCKLKVVIFNFHTLYQICWSWQADVIKYSVTSCNSNFSRHTEKNIH